MWIEECFKKLNQTHNNDDDGEKNKNEWNTNNRKMRENL